MEQQPRSPHPGRHPGHDPGDPYVAVVSGSYGAGHEVAADQMADRLRAAGQVVRRLDMVEELPWRLGRLLRWLYYAQLRWFPSTWGTTLRRLERDTPAFRVVRWLLATLGRSLVRTVAGAEVVVSTHPFASQILGSARAAGRLPAPVVTYLTDASVHRLWVHPAVDLHLAWHDVAAEQARALGGRVQVVAPLVPQVRRSLTPPWPARTAVALVVGGSCGIGELEQTARDVLASGLMVPVVACGHNEELRHRVAAIPGIVALGWRDDLASLSAAADCVLQNAGGMTSLESLAAGTPTISYRPIPGHGTTNALALEQAGLVPWARDCVELRAALALVLLRGRAGALPEGAPSVAVALAGLAPRRTPEMAPDLALDLDVDLVADLAVA